MTEAYTAKLRRETLAGPSADIFDGKTRIAHIPPSTMRTGEQTLAIARRFAALPVLEAQLEQLIAHAEDALRWGDPKKGQRENDLYYRDVEIGSYFQEECIVTHINSWVYQLGRDHFSFGTKEECRDGLYAHALSWLFPGLKSGA